MGGYGLLDRTKEDHGDTCVQAVAHCADNVTHVYMHLANVLAALTHVMLVQNAVGALWKQSQRCQDAARAGQCTLVWHMYYITVN